MKKSLSILLSILLTGTFAFNSAAQSVNVIVPANGGWVGTGVTKDAGVDIIVCASGSATIWPAATPGCWRWAPPSGIGGLVACPGCVCTSCPRVSLIGMFSEGIPFFIGDLGYIDHADAGSGQLFLRVNDIALNQADNLGGFQALVATSCSGDIKLSKCLSNVNNGLSGGGSAGRNAEELNINSNAFLVYPNPASDIINIEFSTPEEAEVEISLIDVTGKLVAYIDRGTYAEGSHLVNYTLEKGQANSLLFVEVNINGEKQIQKLVVTD